MNYLVVGVRQDNDREPDRVECESIADALIAVSRFLEAGYEWVHIDNLDALGAVLSDPG